jgi:hypothetical protein
VDSGDYHQRLQTLWDKLTHVHTHTHTHTHTHRGMDIHTVFKFVHFRGLERWLSS